MSIKRVRAVWSGFPGGPGVSTFYYDTITEPPLASLRSLLQSFVTYIPAGVKIQIENVGQEVDPGTGKAVGNWSAGVQSVITGTGLANYAAPVGGMIKWRTGVFLNGREVKGKTFLVPLGADCFDSTGTIGNSIVTAANNAIAAYVATAGTAQQILSRSSGGVAKVTSGELVDKAMVLTSRRA